ncbi:MAG: hypothetical protein K9J33_16855, partial [Bacteroidales bacterium]|nr:hypothetical protein [Bacteroidales bacterium]
MKQILQNRRDISRECFNKDLSYLRQFAEVKTMTMEGAPLSRYDNRNLWNNETTLNPNLQHRTPNYGQRTTNNV